MLFPSILELSDRSRSVLCFWVIVSCVWVSTVAASDSKPPQRSELAALRSEIGLLYDTAGRLQMEVGQAVPHIYSGSARWTTAPELSRETLRAMLLAGITPDWVRSHAKVLQGEATYWQRWRTMRSTLIEEDGIEVDPAVCKSSSWAEVFGLLQSLNTVETLLAGAKWSCRQEDNGFNAALVCLPMEEAAAVLRNAQRSSAICLGAQGSGRSDATLENLHEMVDLANEQLNVTVGSRSSEEQVDTVKDNTQDVQDTLDDYLPANLPQIQNNLDIQISNLQDNEQLLLDAVVRLQDLATRGLLLHAEAEDQAQRLADTQQLMMEVRQDTQAIKNQLTGVDAQIDQNATARQMEFGRLRLQRMAAILLADTDGVTVEFQVPALFGGQLEVVRDFVWSRLQQAQGAGLNVAPAMQAFSDGDAALNAADYHLAYFNYAKAYRSAVSAAAP